MNDPEDDEWMAAIAGGRIAGSIRPFLLPMLFVGLLGVILLLGTLLTPVVP